MDTVSSGFWNVFWKVSSLSFCSCKASVLVSQRWIIQIKTPTSLKILKITCLHILAWPGASPCHITSYSVNKSEKSKTAAWLKFGLLFLAKFWNHAIWRRFLDRGWKYYSIYFIRYKAIHDLFVQNYLCKIKWLGPLKKWSISSF
jgi:hypothetical protein